MRYRFGMVLTEAMACDKPVIGSNVGGIKEIIDNGEDGFFIFHWLLI